MREGLGQQHVRAVRGRPDGRRVVGAVVADRVDIGARDEAEGLRHVPCGQGTAFEVFVGDRHQPSVRQLRRPPDVPVREFLLRAFHLADALVTDPPAVSVVISLNRPRWDSVAQTRRPGKTAMPKVRAPRQTVRIGGVASMLLGLRWPVAGRTADCSTKRQAGLGGASARGQLWLLPPATRARYPPTGAGIGRALTARCDNPRHRLGPVAARVAVGHRPPEPGRRHHPGHRLGQCGRGRYPRRPRVPGARRHGQARGPCRRIGEREAEQPGERGRPEPARPCATMRDHARPCATVRDLPRCGASGGGQRPGRRSRTRCAAPATERLPGAAPGGASGGMRDARDRESRAPARLDGQETTVVSSRQGQ